jgi:hypothetical protein
LIRHRKASERKDLQCRHTQCIATALHRRQDPGRGSDVAVVDAAHHRVQDRRAARQSTSVLICLGLAHAPSFLRAIYSIPSFGIAEFVVNVCFLRCQQKCQQIGQLQ